MATGGSIPLSQVPPNHQIHAGQLPSVRAVESAYFKQHQYIQPMARPLAEVLGTGNFFFLQDSELDSPDVPNNISAHQNSERPPICQIAVSYSFLQHHSTKNEKINVIIFIYVATTPTTIVRSSSANQY